MDEKLSQLQNQVVKIDNLSRTENWGPEYQLWKNTTEKLVKEMFGEEGLKLFDQQRTVTFSYLEDDFNDSQYQDELSKRKVILEGLLEGFKEHQLKDMQGNTSETDTLKELWRKEAALKENLLTSSEAQPLFEALKTHLERTLPPDSLPGLRFRKIKSDRRYQTWWTGSNGYPIDNPWEKMKPFLELLEQHEAEKTIKARLETEGLFVESRSQGEDQHLLIGQRDGTGEKAHIVIDGKTGEIRVKETEKAPEDLVTKIETILTLPSGKRIRSTREAIEETS